MSSNTDNDRARVLELLKKHGAHATSFQILEDGYDYWIDDGLEAVVAYVKSGRWRVAAGPPVAAPESRVDAAEAFVAAARVKGERALFFSADEDFLNALKGQNQLRFDAVPIGSQPEWDPQDYHYNGPERRSLRSQVRRAQRKGVSVRRVGVEELLDEEGDTRRGIQSVVAEWLASRKMSVMRFMVDVELFDALEERRIYVGEADGEVVGVLGAIPVYQKNGWFFEDVLRVADAPNGTAELLIHEAMLDVAADGARYATLGLSPLSDIRRESDHKVIRSMLRTAYQRSDLLYPFEGIHRFKQRFRPDRWAPQYLVACPPRAGLRALYRVLKVFAGGRLLSFGMRTLNRVLARVPKRFWYGAVMVMGLLLVPWTVGLAVVSPYRWFGHPSMQWAWIVFDTLMVFALMGLARWIRRDDSRVGPFSTFLAGAVLTDLLLTTVQWGYLHHNEGWWAILITLVAMSAPALASLLLVAIAIAYREG